MSRRPLAFLAAVLAVVAAGVGVATVGSEAGDSGSYRVDVIFDDSRGLLVGQLVQVAGARVGQVADVTVTDEYKARVHLEVDSRFAPFRRDATCTIKPSGLIAENYVQCDPGTPDAPALAARGDTTPTVPVENTTQPVSLTDLFEVWNTPTRERLGVLLSTLGIATAGRGEEVNDILRRANPTLALARQAISLLEAQRDDLAAIVDRTAVVADELARRPERLRGVVRHAGRVLTETALRRGDLAEGLQRLPGLLEQARPALRRLDALAAAGVPLVEDLDQAAPALNRVSADIPDLAAAARPTLSRLGPVLAAGTRTARDAAPISKLVAEYARTSLPTTATGAEMLTTLEQRGFLRSLLSFFYNATMAAARYDAHGHLIPAHVTFTRCGEYATTPDPACGAPTASERKRRSRRTDEPEPANARGRDHAGRPDRRRPGLGERLPRLPDAPDAELPPLPDTGVPPLDETLDELLDFLLR